MTDDLPSGERPVDCEYYQFDIELEEFVTRWLEAEHLNKEEIVGALEHWVNWIRSD